MRINTSLAILGLFITTSKVALATQPVYGQDVGSSPYEAPAKKGEKKVLYGEVEDIYENSKGETSPLHNPKNLNDDWTKKISGRSAFMSQSEDHYLEFKNDELIKDIYKKGKSSWSFIYLYDTFDYKDRENIFESTFRNEDSAKSVQSGYLMLGYRKKLWRAVFDGEIGVDSGLSYNTGRGKFSDNSELSRATVRLWIIPVDFVFAMKLNMTRYAGLTFGGGPSIVGMIQNRSDRSENDQDKNLNQVGTGYNAQASLDFSLSQIFPDYGMNMKLKSDISDLSMSLTAKTVNYSNFKNSDVKISGASVGLSFKFELL